MDITNAEFDFETGGPIVPGQIIFNTNTEPHLILCPHDYLLLQFHSSWICSGLIISPIVSSQRLENGFRKTLHDTFHLSFSVDKKQFNVIQRYGAGKKTSASFDGSFSGYFGIQNQPVFKSLNSYVSPQFSNVSFETTQTQKGVQIEIIGSITDETLLTLLPTLDGEPLKITVNALISWEQMVLMGLGAQHYMLPPLEDKTTQILESTPRSDKLHELIMCTSSGNPTVPGIISMTPCARRPWQKNLNFHSLTFGEFSPDSSGLRFHDDARVTLYSNGFAHTTSTSYYVDFSIIGGPELEKLRGSDSIHLSISGNSIGSIRYDSGYGEEASDPNRFIYQQMKSLNFYAELTSLGVELKIWGELNGFETDLLELHEQKGVERVPGKEFNIQATIPWPLLLIRGFSFAEEKASRFMNVEKLL